jgi:predicted phage tail protein
MGRVSTFTRLTLVLLIMFSSACGKMSRASLKVGVVGGTNGQVDAPPSIPAGVTATAGTGNIVLNWTASTGASPIAYTVARSTTSGSGYAALGACTGVSVTTCADSTTDNGTTYYYVVTAINVGGSSGNSSEVTGEPIAAFTMTNLAVNNAVGPDALQVSWPVVLGAASYDISWGTSGSSAGVGSATGITSPYTMSSLTAGTPYTVLITASNTVGSGNSVAASSTLTATPMTRPVIGALTQTISQQATIAWTGGEGATSFTVAHGASSGT